MQVSRQDVRRKLLRLGETVLGTTHDPFIHMRFPRFNELRDNLHMVNEANPTIANSLVEDAQRVFDVFFHAEEQLTASYEGIDLFALPDEETDKFEKLLEDIDTERRQNIEPIVQMARQYSQPERLNRIAQHSPLMQFAMEMA